MKTSFATVFFMFVSFLAFSQITKYDIYFNVGSGRSTLIQNPVSGEGSGNNPFGTFELGINTQLKNRFYLASGLSYNIHWIYTRNNLTDLNGTTIIDYQPETRLNTYMKFGNLGLNVTPQYKIKQYESYSAFIGLGYSLGYYTSMASNYFSSIENSGQSENLQSLISPWNHSIHCDLTFWSDDKKSNIFILNVFRVRFSMNFSGLSGKGDLPFYNLGLMFGL